MRVWEFQFSYDDEGQLQAKAATTFEFNYDHRLKQINGTQTAQFFYDVSGNRLKAVRGGTETRYIYDLAGNLLAEADATGTITRYFIHGLGLLAMVTPDDQVYTYHFDGNGNTIAMTDGIKQVVNKYAYLPYGKIIASEELIEQPFTFAGMVGIMKEVEGLYYMRARYYDPSVGRFISEDPSGFSDGPNLYAYVGGSPLMFVDSWGLCKGFNYSESFWNNFWEEIYKNNIRQDWHFDRNKMNQNITYEQAKEQWILMSPGQSIYHQQGPGNENNLKFISPDGHSEAIFRPDGTPVTDPVNMPTYNYGDPIHNPFGHFIYDMIPYYFWGNVRKN